MTARRDAAAILAICASVRHRIAKIEDAAKEVVDCTYADEKVAAVVDGTVVATTGRYERKPREPFVVLDPEGLADWVAERWPTEVVRAVRPAFLNTVLFDRVRDGVLIDDQGEICQAVKVKDSEVSVRTYLKKGDQVDEAMAPFMAIALEDLPQLIEGGDEF